MEFYNKKPLPRCCSIMLGILLVVLLAAVWFFRASVVSPRRPRRVILISIDTCRADYLSCYGCPLKTTPNIDAVAAEAVRFEHVIASNPLTLPSHSTMMTGTIPPHHGIHDNLNYTLNQSNVTLAEILKNLLAGTIPLTQEEHQEHARLMDAKILARYSKLKTARKGFAVAQVRNGTCSGCRLQIPPQLVAEVKRGDELLNCSYCYRILYWEAPSDKSSWSEAPPVDLERVDEYR